MSTVQISAHVLPATKARLDEAARFTGLSRQAIVEDAILREVAALEEIPEEFIVPVTISLERPVAERLLRMIDNPPAPSETLRKALKLVGVKV